MRSDPASRTPASRSSGVSDPWRPSWLSSENSLASRNSCRPASNSSLPKVAHGPPQISELDEVRKAIASVELVESLAERLGEITNRTLGFLHNGCGVETWPSMALARCWELGRTFSRGRRAVCPCSLPTPHRWADHSRRSQGLERLRPSSAVQGRLASLLRLV